MTNKELNIIKIMTAIINMSQSIVYGARDISQINWNYDGIVYDSKNENKIVASYEPTEHMVLEYWEDLFDMSCRFEKICMVVNIYIFGLYLMMKRKKNLI